MNEATLHDLFITVWGHKLNAGRVQDIEELPYKSTLHGDEYNLSLLPSIHSGRLLEIGSGYGRTADWLTRSFDVVHAVEPNTAKCYSFSYSDKVKLYPEPFETVILTDSYSTVWLSEVYSYFVNFEDVFRKIYLLLKPNGKVLISDFFFANPPYSYPSEVEEAKFIRSSINELYIEDFLNKVKDLGFSLHAIVPWEKRPIQFYKNVRDRMVDTPFPLDIRCSGTSNMDARIRLLNESSYDKYSIVLRKVK